MGSLGAAFLGRFSRRALTAFQAAVTPFPMLRELRTWYPVAVVAALVVAVAVLPGCQVPDQRVVPFEPPHARPLAPADNPVTGRPGHTPNVAMAPTPGCLAPFDPACGDGCPMRRP